MAIGFQDTCDALSCIAVVEGGCITGAGCVLVAVSVREATAACDVEFVDCIAGAALAVVAGFTACIGDADMDEDSAATNTEASEEHAGNRASSVHHLQFAFDEPAAIGSFVISEDGSWSDLGEFAFENLCKLISRLRMKDGFHSFSAVSAPEFTNSEWANEYFLWRHGAGCDLSVGDSCACARAEANDGGDGEEEMFHRAV